MSAIVSELFIEHSVVFHPPFPPLGKVEPNPPLRKVEPKSEDFEKKDEQDFYTTKSPPTSLVFGSTFPKGGFGSTKSPPTSLMFGSTFLKGGFGSTKSPPTSLVFGSTFLKGGFGLISLKTISSSLTESEQDVIFQVDCSGSMSDLCSDGRSKMQHILHTLKNMILYFKENPCLKVYITIHAFDEKIYNIVERVIVDNSTYNSIISAIDTISPRASTNIELALKDVKKYTEMLSQQYPNTTKTHIFMTDGQATTGSNKNNILHDLIDSSITNIFIGFGLDHDAKLLNAVSDGEKSSYYFIDKLENAGLVYGEILHGIVYKFLENVEISVTNGLIYNYKTNTWNPTLKVGEMVSSNSKFYHIMMHSPDTECVVKLTGNRVDNGSDILEFIPVQEEPRDLTKYMYRQRTQELLFKVNEYNKNNDEENYDVRKVEYKKLKSEMHDFFLEIKKYMTDNNLTDDILLKNLCDDVYICHRTFGTELGDMFCTSRGNSQGQQRTYTSTHVPSHTQDFGILRQNAISHYDEEDTNDLHHEVSGSTQTPYRNCSVLNVMRSVTAGSNVDELDDYELTQTAPY